MTDEEKALWNAAVQTIKNSRGSLDPNVIEAIDIVMKPTYALLQTFENERQQREPFVSQAPCPICGSGTVTYRYREPLFGNMICDTPECITLHL